MKTVQTLALFLLSIPLWAQTLAPNVVKTNPHINYAHLNHIDALVKPYLEQKKLIGSVVIVVKDNQVVHYKGYGMADAEQKKPMEANTIFRIMSQTKAITSLAIMQLFEQGKLDLDQKVSDFIPEFKNPTVLKDFNPKDSSYTTVAAKREITIRDLLTHTSGIDYSGIGSEQMKAIYAKANIPSGLGEMKFTLLEKMKDLGKLPLAHQPGDKFTYGLNSDLLGCLVEIISGETLEQYFHKHIFEPLGMKDTYFNLPAEKGNRLAGVYTENEQKQVIPWGPTFRNINPNYPLVKKTFFSGGAGLSSTAYDYAIFLQMLLNKGKYNGQQIIGRRTAELMVSPQLNPGLLGNDNFGLGFQIVSEKSANLKMRSKGSFSWGGYYGTTYWADPKENLIVLIMTQHTPNSNGFLAGRIENIIYGSLK
jgi:CubicO group peptidase (beta-lactamase class C family)